MTTGDAKESAGREKPSPTPSPAELMKRRKRRALWLVLGMLCLSLLVVVLGIYATTRTESVSVTGYISGVILAFGSFLGVLGLSLDENRKQLVVAAIVFLSFGIVASFLCLVVDGVFIVFNIDIRPLNAGRCQFYTSGNSFIYENYFASVPCRSLRESCSMRVRSGTCYCCDLYDCANGGYLNNYYEFVGVRSCQEVWSLYVTIWVLVALHLVVLVLGIVTTAVLGSIKDLKSCSVTPEFDHRSWTQFFSGEREISPPTAPLLSDPPAQQGHQLYPRASLYFSPSVGPDASPSSQSKTPHPDPNPPPFAPPYNLLPYTTQGSSV